MGLQLKPYQWACSITALAMTLDVPVVELIKKLGHNGSEIIWPNLKEPMCRRGFHSQELIHLAWRYGYSVTPFEVFPSIGPSSGYGDNYPVIFNEDENANWQQFFNMIENTKGILEGQCGRCHHALHFDHNEIFDPDGYQYRYSRNRCESFGFFGNRALVFIRHR